MLRYLLKRFVGGVVVITIVTAVVFSVFYILPADPARLACGKSCTPDLIKQIRHTLELDQPLTVQYGRFINGVFVGRTYLKGTTAQLDCSAPCLGYSYQTDQSVTSLIMNHNNIHQLKKREP